MIRVLIGSETTDLVTPAVEPVFFAESLTCGTHRKMAERLDRYRTDDN
jgi:hypothetical protein